MPRKKQQPTETPEPSATPAVDVTGATQTQGAASPGEPKPQPRNVVRGKPISYDELRASDQEHDEEPESVYHLFGMLNNAQSREHKARILRTAERMSGARFDYGNPAKRQRQPSTLSVGRVLNGLSRKFHGPRLEQVEQIRDPDARADAMMHHWVNATVPEVRGEIAERGIGDSGLDYYDHDMRHVETNLAHLINNHPTEYQGIRGFFGHISPTGHLQTNEEQKANHVLYKALLTPTSFANTPHPNLTIAHKIFDDAIAQNPTDPWAAVRGRDANGNLWSGRTPPSHIEYIKNLVAQKGRAGAAQWLLTKHPHLELKSVKKTTQLPLGQSEGEGAFIFGPKGGPYLLNMNQQGDKGVQDRWMTRDYNRSFAKIVSGGQVQDTPQNDQERQIIDRGLAAASAEVGLTPGEYQAVSWLYNRRMWNALGSKVDFSTYKDGINALVQSKGLTPVETPASDPEVTARRQDAVAKAISAQPPRRVQGGPASPQQARRSGDKLRFQKDGPIAGRISGQQWGRQLTPKEKIKEAMKLLKESDPTPTFQDFLYALGENGNHRAGQEADVWYYIQKAQRKLDKKARKKKRIKKAKSNQNPFRPDPSTFPGRIGSAAPGQLGPTDQPSPPTGDQIELAKRTSPGINISGKSSDRKGKISSRVVQAGIHMAKRSDGSYDYDAAKAEPSKCPTCGGSGMDERGGDCDDCQGAGTPQFNDQPTKMAKNTRSSEQGQVGEMVPLLPATREPRPGQQGNVGEMVPLLSGTAEPPARKYSPQGVPPPVQKNPVPPPEKADQPEAPTVDPLTPPVTIRSAVRNFVNNFGIPLSQRGPLRPGAAQPRGAAVKTPEQFVEGIKSGRSLKDLAREHGLDLGTFLATNLQNIAKYLSPKQWTEIQKGGF